MAKKSSVEKNNRRRRLVAQYADRRAKLKEIANDEKHPPELRFQARLKLSQLPRNSSKTRIRNRCQMTGRSRGFESAFGLSRIALREMANNGLLPGVRKASW